MFSCKMVRYSLMDYHGMAAPIARTVAAPVPPTAAVPAAPNPAAPTDWRMATKLPAATPPPFAIATDDIHPAAQLPAAIHPAPKPITPRTAGAATTAPTPAATAPPIVSRPYLKYKHLNKELDRGRRRVDDNQ